MTAPEGEEPSIAGPPDASPTAATDTPTICDEEGCTRPAAVRLHVPWAEDRTICPPHARVLARPDGIVAEPLAGAEDEWP